MEKEQKQELGWRVSVLPIPAFHHCEPLCAMGYRSLCVPSVKHEDKPDTWMLFRLERRIKKAKAKPAAEGGEGGEGEGGEKEGAEGSGAGGSKLVGPTTDDRYEAWMQTGYNRIYGKEDEAQQS